MTKLLDDEVEDDENFWNQDALREVVFRFLLFEIFESSERGSYLLILWSCVMGITTCPARWKN